MPRSLYLMTPTAREHLKTAVKDTRKIWGAKQARKYGKNFLGGLQDIADNHRTFHSPHRAALAEGTPFSLHLVEHRYVVFQAMDENTIIISGIFHQNMDIPTRLKELQKLEKHEIAALQRRTMPQ
jgi:plasmid stabilization system protein ParE